MSLSKREAIAVKKETIVDTFLAAGWKPNTDYSRRLNERGQVIYLRGTGVDHFLISPDKRYAVTIKPQVFTLHDATRNYCKVLSVKHEEVEIFPERMVSGILEVRIK